MALEAYSKSTPKFVTRYDDVHYSLVGPGAESFNQVFSNTIDCSAILNGFKNSSYKDQIANGQNATTPLDASDKQVIFVNPCVYKAGNHYPNGSVSSYSGSFESFWGFPNLNTDLLSTADNLARTMVYNQIASNFKGLTVLGELGETLSMIRRPAIGLRKGLDLYLSKARPIRNRFASLRRHKGYLDAIAELWLEYSFGWKPLLNDVKSGIDAFNERRDRHDFTPFKVTSRQRATGHGFWGNFSHTAMPVVHTEATYEYEASVAYAGESRLKLQVSGTPAVASTTLPDFVPAAWELLPWSFFVDYFVNIGSILECWATAQNYEIVYSSRTKRNLATATFVADVRGYTPQIGNFNLGLEGVGSAATLSKTVSRDIPTDLPFPRLAVTTHWTAPRELNIASLLVLWKADRRFSRD